ncbi:MAG: 50S ribosomal protein L25/general stress protein Ctc [Snodgrassella sp.]|jgi:large subunit ribosomal protein L25|nr:50S ribosomal protein L25/general stress protein Ctc [Snodgrassella sp.]
MSYEIKAEIREAQGTGASRRLRREGKVPAVLYGEGTEPIAITVDHRTLWYALEKESFHTAIIKLDVNGKAHNVIIRDFQMHPFKQQVQHIDFQAVDAKKPVNIRVPLHLVNAAISPAEKLQSGRVSLLTTSVEVSALPKDIPSALDLDVATISAGEIRHLSDLVFPAGVTSVALNRNENLAIAAATGKKSA